MKDAYELATYFVNQITEATIGIEARVNSALASIPALIDRGWTLEEIKKELDQFKLDYPKIATNVYHIDEIMNKKEPPDNIMEPDVFYYHSELRRMSSVPVIKRDPVTEKMVRFSEPFYLEMKNRYTMKDLMAYWYKEMGIEPNEHMIRQDEGKFKYILGNYTLDEVLFSIDVSKIIRKEQQIRPLRNAFELDRYMEDAREFIQKKKNTHKVEGINREFRRSSS